jgi:hypothetical protein
MTSLRTSAPSFIRSSFPAPIRSLITILPACACILVGGSSQAATVRPDGLIDAPGGVLFPLGLIELGTYKYEDWNDRIRRSKANVIWDTEIAYADTTPSCAAVMDSAEATGYYLFVGSSDTWNWDNLLTPDFEVDQLMYEADELPKLLECAANSPSVIGFANRDEPSWTLSRGLLGDIDFEHIHWTYGQLHDAVPNTFVGMNHAPAHLSLDIEQWKQDIIAYRDATDVMMFACYPYPAGPGTCSAINVVGFPECSMDRLAIAADIFRFELNGPGQPLWLIIQAHKGIPLKESRWEAYISVIHGATGILWAGWTWTHILGGGEENWPITEQVISEMASLHPFLISDDISGLETDNADVEVRGKRIGSFQSCVFAASRNGFSGTAQIYLPGAGDRKVTLPFEDRFLVASDGWIEDSFDGYEGHVYRYSKSSEVPDFTRRFDIEAFNLLLSPNPSSGATRAQFVLPRESAVLFTVYDAAGRKVAVAGSGKFPAGRHEVTWSGHNYEGKRVSPGLYFIRGETSEGKTASAKVMITR